MPIARTTGGTVSIAIRQSQVLVVWLIWASIVAWAYHRRFFLAASGTISFLVWKQRVPQEIPIFLAVCCSSNIHALCLVHNLFSSERDGQKPDTVQGLFFQIEKPRQAGSHSRFAISYSRTWRQWKASSFTISHDVSSYYSRLELRLFVSGRYFLPRDTTSILLHPCGTWWSGSFSIYNREHPICIWYLQWLLPDLLLCKDSRLLGFEESIYRRYHVWYPPFPVFPRY